ncbi:hypothetical protein PROFUN_09125 [Planoprotostelium fungivorum]|uniref:Polycystin cation channel PKD1/PKD2 domain-containing protein n=1 Tax=Planoprotostelium fungivorum TaxID=1890364 RepID=A0A2P6NHY7_9EUKA|nr:hypothetical protein PROFUN_09125 [Planoprotostelium fungivorum]
MSRTRLDAEKTFYQTRSHTGGMPRVQRPEVPTHRSHELEDFYMSVPASGVKKGRYRSRSDIRPDEEALLQRPSSNRQRSTSRSRFVMVTSDQINALPGTGKWSTVQPFQTGHTAADSQIRSLVTGEDGKVNDVTNNVPAEREGRASRSTIKSTIPASGYFESVTKEEDETEKDFSDEEDTWSEISNTDTDRHMQNAAQRQGLSRNLFKCFGREKPKMSPSAMLTASWWDKWTIYGRFPWKILIQALIIISSTTAILLYNSQTSFYLREMAVGSPENDISFHSINDTVEFVQHCVNQYYGWPEDSIEGILYGTTINSPPKDPTLTVLTRKTNNGTDTMEDVYRLNSTYLGPLQQPWPQLQNLFHRTISMDIAFQLYSYEFPKAPERLHKWDIQVFLAASNGHVKASLSVEYDDMISDEISLWKGTRMVSIFFFVTSMILALILQVLAFTSLKRSFVIFQTLKAKSSHKAAQLKSKIVPWDKIPLGIKLRFFNHWFIVSFVACAFIVIGSIFGALTTMGYRGQYDAVRIIFRLLFGLGTLLTWAGFTRFLAFDDKYTVLISALGRGLPNIMRFLVSAVPIFFGYCFFGILYFSEDTIRFSSLGQAAVTLFGLQNGDDIQVTLRSIAPHAIVGGIYFFTFIFLAIYAITNIFISIMSDAYDTSKKVWHVGQMSGEIPGGSSEPQEENTTNPHASIWEDLIAMSDDREVGDIEEDVVHVDTNPSPLIDIDSNTMSPPTSQTAPTIQVEERIFNIPQIFVSDESSGQKDTKTSMSEAILTLRKQMEDLMEEEQRKYKENVQRGLDKLIQDFSRDRTNET